MLTAPEVKQILYTLGADLCGVAPISRFDEAPEGFHPLDVLPACKSVIVFAKKFPGGTLHCKTTVPYTVARNLLSSELDRMSVQFCAVLEENKIIAVPTGTISHTRYDAKTGRSRGIVSAKHCAAAAGLGRIGKNTLLVTPEYGNMVWLSVVLADAALEPDEVLPGSPCKDGCTLCADHCPVRALGNPEMNQKACHAHAFHTDEGEEFTFKCHACRTICPNRYGSQNAWLETRARPNGHGGCCP